MLLRSVESQLGRRSRRCRSCDNHLASRSVAGPNGDTASFGYDTYGHHASTTSLTGAVTNYTYNDSASPPYKTATTNNHWVQTAMDGFGHTIQTLNTGASVVATHHDPCAAPRSAKSAKSHSRSHPTDRCIGPTTPMTPPAAPPALRRRKPTEASLFLLKDVWHRRARIFSTTAGWLFRKYPR
jgi:hypothetical protein